MSFVLMPLLLSIDVASASSACDHIQATLNDKRVSHVLDVPTDDKLQVLE